MFEICTYRISVFRPGSMGFLLKLTPRAKMFSPQTALHGIFGLLTCRSFKDYGQKGLFPRIYAD
jgi:hypothetical protein